MKDNLITVTSDIRKHTAEYRSNTMKQKTSGIIGKRLKKINRYLQKTGGRFKPESIHSFRIEVKKLRSFLKLIAVNKEMASVPKTIKKLYKILGKIRLIQIQH